MAHALLRNSPVAGERPPDLLEQPATARRAPLVVSTRGMWEARRRGGSTTELTCQPLSARAGHLRDGLVPCAGCRNPARPGASCAEP